MNLTGRNVQSHTTKRMRHISQLYTTARRYVWWSSYIVHYFIQIFKTTVEITDLTYSVDVMYNDTLYIVLLAQNCAGYSSYVITALLYEPGRMH